MKNLEVLEKKIGLKFRNKNLLREALTHSSFAKENNSRASEAIKDNERLEFLGDAVLEMAVSELLYQGFDRKEGELTLLRTKLVEQGQLVLLAEDLNLAQYLLIGKGVKLEGRARNYLLANAFEALTAAIYLEQGFEKSKLFINKIITPYLQKWIKSSTIKNAKNDLQELTQETLRCLPEYRLVEESGPAHNRNFIVSVSLKNKEVGRGEGKSKKEAEIIAAQKALSKLTSRKQ